MPRTFYSSRRYHPAYSPLGRLFRSWTGDRLRGEAFYIVTLTVLALILVLSHYLGWALLEPYLRASPSRQLAYWGIQLASVSVWAAVGLVGFRPGVGVTCRRDAVDLEQGTRSLTLPYSFVKTVTVISGTRYHRHYRRYADTQSFVADPSDQVLLLRTKESPVIIGLADAHEQQELNEHLHTVCGRNRDSNAGSDKG